jgi:hypothetical protein
MCIFMVPGVNWPDPVYKGFPLCEPCGLPCSVLASCEDFYTCKFDLTKASRCDLASCTRPCAVRDFKVKAVVLTNELGTWLLENMLEGEI